LHRFRLPKDLRNKLKSPIGELIPGPPKSSIVRVKQIISSMKPSKIICVGDFVSRLLVDSSIRVDLVVIDNRTMRRTRQERESLRVKGENVFRVSNPAGTIQIAAWAALSEALGKPDSTLIVKGEEDLLTLAAIALAPRDALVVYGQPCEGMVAVRVNTAKKSEAAFLVSQMTRE